MELHDKRYPIPDKELINKKFGRWTVLKKAGQGKDGCSYWFCKCDCGTEKAVKEYNLLLNKSKSCKKCSINHQKEYPSLKRGRQRKPDGIACRNHIYYEYKRRAIKKWGAFKLTEDEFIYLISDNCYYCGKEPDNIKKSLSNSGDYIYNGIDRLNNIEGYTVDNCVSCCETCNRAKLKMGKSEFLEWIDKVYLYQHKNK